MRGALILGFVSLVGVISAPADAQPRRTAEPRREATQRRYYTPPRGYYGPRRYYVAPRRYYVAPGYYYAGPRYYYYRAQPDYREEPAVRAEARHTGLFARGVFGAGAVSADDELNDSRLSGGAGLFSFDLGASVTPGLALHGRLALSSVFEPNVSSQGRFAGELQDTSLTFTLIGVGATYYFPSNVYLTGVAGVSTATFEFFGGGYDTLSGVGGMADLGYEWPVGNEVGLGIAGRFELHSVRDDAGTLSTGALGVLFSLTYF